MTASKLPANNFNPRSLAGATLITADVLSVVLNFNPRSLAGATHMQELAYHRPAISIHAPLRERRTSAPKKLPYAKDFNPRSLAGATIINKL